MSEPSALLPCPFCGPGQSIVSLWFDDVSKRWRVGCGRCGCSTGTSPRDKTQAPAIAAWNTRAAPAPQGEPVAWMLRSGIHQLDLTWVPSRTARWLSNGGDVRPLYAAPVPQPEGPQAREALEHAQVRFRCIADEAEERGDTAGWAMASVDAERMAKAIAALPSSPAPLEAPQNTAERLPSSDAADGAGEAISPADLAEECAKIAEGHVGAWPTSVTGDERSGYDEACLDIAKAIRDAHGSSRS